MATFDCQRVDTTNYQPFKWLSGCLVFDDHQFRCPEKFIMNHDSRVCFFCRTIGVQYITASFVGCGSPPFWTWMFQHVSTIASAICSIRKELQPSVELNTWPVGFSLESAPIIPQSSKNLDCF